MSGCEATDEIKSIIRAMAKAKLEEGVTDHEDILDAIHAAIHEHTPLWKNEIADIISGYGQKSTRQPTRTELQERVLQLKRDLREAYHPKPPPKGKPAPKTADQVANQRRQTQIKNEITKLQEQLRTGNFSKSKRAEPNYDATTQKLQAELETARRLADREMRRLEYQNRSRAAKVADTFLAFHRAMILSGLGTLEHLTGAASSRLIFAPIEDVAGGVLHMIPGVRQYSEAAPTEGGGLSLSALGAGYGRTFSKQTLKDMRDKVVRGFSDLQAVMKDPYDSNHRLLDAVGHIHDALKTQAENFAYAKALVNQAQQARKALARAGKSPAEIDRALIDPAMIASMQTQAYDQALRAKLQGNNLLVSKYQQLQHQLETAKTASGDPAHAARAFAGFLRYVLPIVKIPVNLADEVLSGAVGELRAFGAGFVHRKEAITPELADYVMRNLKKGAVGKVLMLVGWLGYQSLGAMYDQQRRKKPGEPDYGDIRLGEHTVPHQLLHAPQFELMMATALARRVYEQRMAQQKRKEQPQTPASDAVAAAGHALQGVLNTIPFIEAPVEFWRGITNPGDYLGRKVAENEPQALKDVAKWTDHEQALSRRPEGFLQQVEAGIPGLREQVPTRALKGMTLDQKLDAYAKMSPKERERTGILESINSTAGHARDLTDDQRKRLDEVNQ